MDRHTGIQVLVRAFFGLPIGSLRMFGSDVTPRVGGWLTLLVVLHFVVDWVFQSHDEAMRKPREWRVRAKHCAVYTFPFAIVLLQTTWEPWRAVGMGALVFLSHFVEDTYYPVLLWAKYVRRPPQMRRILIQRLLDFAIMDDGVIRLPILESEKRWVTRLNKGGFTDQDRIDAQKDIDMEGFVQFVSEPLGKILLIAIDQTVHILFLVPVAYMMAVQP